MKKSFLLFTFCSISLLYSQTDYKTLHFKSIVADTHNDILTEILKGRGDISSRLTKGHTDLVRLKEGGVDIQVFSVWSDEKYGNGTAYKRANTMIDTLENIIKRNPKKIALVKNPKELQKVLKEKKLAAIIGVEGGHMLEDKMEYLENLYKRGMRYLTLTWNNSTSWATSAKDEELKKDLSHKGLTEFGKKIVRKMNELGVMVDVSHVGEQTFYDVINTSTKPVIASHSAVYKLAPHRRNLKDEQIKAIAKKGGVVFINFYSAFIDTNYNNKISTIRKNHQALVDSIKQQYKNEDDADDVIDSLLIKEYETARPPLSVLIDHIDYVAKLVGADCVGLGSDFDGVESVPQEMDDVTCYPKITRELQKRGYSDKDIAKILGGNFVRVFSEVCK